MQLKVSSVREVLQMLSDKTGIGLDHSGLKAISEKVFPDGNHRYLYHNVMQKIKDRRDDDEVNLNQYHVDKIAAFLGFTSWELLQGKLGRQPDPVLESLHGCYYCYVRASHHEGQLLRSPVIISSNKGKTWLRLQGKNWVFEGEVKLREGCLFILMESSEGKSFYHVYRIGTRRSPEVLQGIFAGVSTAFDPIGGRTVLVRQDGPAESLTNLKIPISKLQASADPSEQLLGKYFQDFSKNNLSPNKSVGFSWEDLD